MKKLLVLCTVLFCTTLTTTAQDFSDLDKSPMDVTIIRNEDNSPMARIIYSRPKKRGRVIFGELVPYGKVWRTGANEATEITLYDDMVIGGQRIPSGTYTLFTIPTKTEWTIILNKEIHLWGAFNYDEEKDLVRIKAPARKAAATIEDFSIAFQPIKNGTNLFMGWDDTYVMIPFTKAKEKTDTSENTENEEN